MEDLVVSDSMPFEVNNLVYFQALGHSLKKFLANGRFSMVDKLGVTTEDLPGQIT